MKFQTGNFYHFYSRSNNEEIIFKDENDFLFFLERYRRHLDPFVSTLGYCLMPTHFHFIIKVITEDCGLLKKNIAALLGGYTKVVNKLRGRHGSLFQPRAKAKEINDERYLLTLLAYVHQNPLRAQLAKRLEDWKYSSYADLAGLRNGSLPDREFIRKCFSSPAEFKEYSEELIAEVRREYWV
jgi:putative transposase